MAGQRGNAWWLFAFFGLGSAGFGLVGLIGGTTYLAESVAGQTNEALQASAPEAYRLVEVEVRLAGLQYVAFGILIMAIAWTAFRECRRWAWWAMWTFPLAGVAQGAIIVASTAPGEAIDGAALTGSVVAIIGAAVLLWSAPAFRSAARRSVSSEYAASKRRPLPSRSRGAARTDVGVERG